MSRAARFFLFLSLSIVSLIASAALLLGQMRRYNALLETYPAGSFIAGVPVGGLNHSSARERLESAYLLTPVEIRVDGAPVHVMPAEAGARVDIDGMLAAEEGLLSGQSSYWRGLWNLLWNRVPDAVESELACSVDIAQMRAYLKDVIAPRYTQPSLAGAPAAPGDVLFRPGQPGLTLDTTSAEVPLRNALCDPARPVVELSSRATEAMPPGIADLDALLRTLTFAPGFDGLVEVYFQDLATGQEINYAYNAGLPVQPGVAFTAASTIKIPVMVSAFKRIEGEMPPTVRQQMELMIDLSDNGSTDEVMQSVLDPNIAPVEVTQDLRALGLENTFLAGFFYPGAPLLDRYESPANRRADLSTDPDIYNQTTPADMGRLLAAIQRCASGEENPLTSAFGGQITREECAVMTDLLAKNRKGVLIETGVPDGTRVAHKYGWVTDPVDGLMHQASDAAIVTTEGGSFVLSVYFYDADQLNWFAANVLSARLVTASVNFYNQR